MGLNWNELVGKKVYLVLNNNNEYNATIVAVDNKGNGLIFIELIDKFNDKIIFSTGEIKFIKVKEGGERK